MKTNKPVLNPSEIKGLLTQTRTSFSEGWGAMARDKVPNKGAESLHLHCTKCNVNTSGIILDPLKGDERHCPSCSSPLLYCPRCKHLASGTEKFKVLTCDSCHEDYVTDITITDILTRDRHSKEIVISGIRASGRLHLGNYLGAVEHFLQYERDNNLCLYFIADFHTLTTARNPEKLRKNSYEIALDYLAAGLNPERSLIYNQSSVPEIAEISLYLSMFQNHEELLDLPTVKDMRAKAAAKGESTNLGIVLYPVLMAADILGARATIVPVGKDQLPNLELVRSLASRVNREIGSSLVSPKAGPIPVKVPSLSGGKMGKSEEGELILLTDSLEEVKRKYRKGISDPQRISREMPGIPGNCVSVFPVYEILARNDSNLLNEIREGCSSGKLGCVDCKYRLSEEIYELLLPFQERRAELARKPEFVKEVLHFGGLKAREIFSSTLEELRERIGFLP